MRVSCVELAVLKAHYSVKLKTYEQMKATSTKGGGYVNVSNIGIKV